jgi:hypothetical protein
MKGVEDRIFLKRLHRSGVKLGRLDHKINSGGGSRAEVQSTNQPLHYTPGPVERTFTWAPRVVGIYIVETSHVRRLSRSDFMRPSCTMRVDEASLIHIS